MGTAVKIDRENIYLGRIHDEKSKHDKHSAGQVDHAEPGRTRDTPGEKRGKHGVDQIPLHTRQNQSEYRGQNNEDVHLSGGSHDALEYICGQNQNTNQIEVADELHLEFILEHPDIAQQGTHAVGHDEHGQLDHPANGRQDRGHVEKGRKMPPINPGPVTLQGGNFNRLGGQENTQKKHAE